MGPSGQRLTEGDARDGERRGRGVPLSRLRERQRQRLAVARVDAVVDCTHMLRLISRCLLGQLILILPIDQQAALSCMITLHQ